MKIKTKAFGTIEISEKQRIFFKNGILGFEDIHNFVLLDSPDESAFYWLQAEDIPEIAFVIIDPLLVVPDYKLDVDPKDVEDLDIKNHSDLLVFSIVTVHDKVQDITINLLGPVIINKNNHSGKQVINQMDNYTVKHPLFQRKEEKC